MKNDELTFDTEEKEKQYGKFVHDSVKKYIDLFKEDSEVTFYDPLYLLLYLMKTFDFTYIYDGKDIGIKDNDVKELFIRRQIDDFHWFVLSSCDDIDEVYNSYLLFFHTFCINYRIFCLERNAKYIRKVISKDMVDKLECIIDREHNGVTDIEYTVIKIDGRWYLTFEDLNFNENNEE